MKQQASQAPLGEGVAVGDYVIQRALGHDGQGYRYLARGRAGSCILHELFPLQVVRRGEASVEAIDPGDRSALRWWTRSYLDRARLFAAAHHPALAPIDASFEANGTAWHASRPSTGAPLSELLEQGRRFDVAELQRLLADVLDALSAVHALSLVHRAIDPRQVWVHADGSAMLRGFGSLRGSLRLHLHAVHSVASPPYAAPEEMTPDAPVAAAADIYALAAIAWQLVSGQTPPDIARRGAAAPLRTLAGDAWPAALIDGIEHAFDPDPQRRPSAQDWRATLPSAATPARRAVTVPPASAQRSVFAPLAAATAVLAGFALGAWWLLRPAPQATTVAIAVATPAAAAMPATALNRPRFMPTSLAVEDGGPALDQAALERISEETPRDDPALAAESGVSPISVAPAPAAITTPAAVAPATPTPPRVVATPVPTPNPAGPAAADPVDPAANTTSPSRPLASASPSVGAGIEVAALQPVAVPSLNPEQAARIEAEDRARAKAQQLALERSRCDRHISELFANRDFTYADIAGFDDVVKLSNGRLQTPSMRTDDGRRVSFLIDRNGCIVRVIR